MLEAAGLDRAMHAALFRRSGLPPPSARPWIGAFLHRTRAGTASNRRIALVVEFVVRNVISPDVIPDFVLGPVGERRDLHHAAMVVIDLDLADIRSCRPLVAAQTRHPTV